MAINTSLLIGTYSITNGTTNVGDIIYAYLCHDNSCETGEYIASSVGPQSLTYGDDTWTDTSNGTNCYEAGCISGQFKIQFNYDSTYENKPILFLINSQANGILPQRTEGIDVSQIACNNFFSCDTQTPDAVFEVPSPTHTLNRTNSNPVEISDSDNIDLVWNYSGVDDGYGNDDLYWSDGGQTSGVYVSQHTWTIKKNAVNVDETAYSDLTSNTSIQSDLTIRFSPDEIVSNVATEQYTAKLESRVVSLNSFNDAFYNDSSKTYTINVSNSDYITPLTNMCGDETATNYICLNTMYGGNSDYCPGGGCDFGGCASNMWVDDDLIVTIDNSVCNYQPGAVLQVSNAPGSIQVMVSGLGSTDQNGYPDIATWYYTFGDGNTVSRNNGNPYVHTYDVAGTYTITLVVTDDAGSSSDSDEIEITLNKCGCTDSLADNYVSTADTEDGTCVYSGCSYVDADVPFCSQNSCGYQNGTLSCANSWPCSGTAPDTNSICSNTTPTYPDLSSVTDDGTCTFTIFVDPDYTGVITNYILSTEVSEYITDTGITGTPLGHVNLDAQIRDRMDTNYSSNFVPYFDDVRVKVEEQEGPDFCNPSGSSDASNAGYCDNSICKGYHLNLMEEASCSGVCTPPVDSVDDVSCVVLDCGAGGHCASTYCDIGNASECCTSLGTSGADSCTTAISCASQHAGDWCPSADSQCCGGCTADDGTCCASHYPYRYVDLAGLAGACLGQGDGYCDTCCLVDDCTEFYEDISTQFASVVLPLLSKQSETDPVPSWFGYVADEPQLLDDVLEFTGPFSGGDMIIGRNYDEDTGEVLGGFSPARFDICPPNQNMGANCDNFVCPASPTMMWKNPSTCFNPNAMRKLIPGRGYIYLGQNAGNLSFINN